MYNPLKPYRSIVGVDQKAGEIDYKELSRGASYGVNEDVADAVAVTSTTIINSIYNPAEGQVFNPGAAFYGPGYHGALSLSANLTYPAETGSIRFYTNVTLNGFTIQQATTRHMIALYASGTLDFGTGGVIEVQQHTGGLIGSAAGAAGAAGSAGGGSGGAGARNTGALWVFARKIIGTGTIRVVTNDPVDGNNAAAAAGTGNGSSGTSVNGNFYVNAVAHGAGSNGGGRGGFSTGSGGAGETSPSANWIQDYDSISGTDSERLTGLYFDPRVTIFNGNIYTNAGSAQRHSNYTHITSIQGSGGGAGGRNNGGAQGAGGGGGGCGGHAWDSATSSGAGGNGGAGGSGAGGGGGGGGCGGGWLMVVTQEIPSTVTLEAKGGNGGNGGAGNGYGGGGGGGSGGSGGIIWVICQDGATVTSDVSGGTGGTGGAAGASGGSAGNAGSNGNSGYVLITEFDSEI